MILFFGFLVSIIKLVDVGVVLWFCIVGKYWYSYKNGIKECMVFGLLCIEVGFGCCLFIGMGLLVMIGVIVFFVGLFGIVWGIMNSFIGIL